MILFLYNLLFPIALIAFLPRYFVKMRRRGNYRENFAQRLGFYRSTIRERLAAQREIVWLHAVSVGEVGVALKLATAIKKLQPELFCALTTTTTTGYQFATHHAPSWIQVLYTPLDFWPIMRRAFSVIRPGKIVLVEAEVWPNLMTQARRRSIPVALVNARLSPRSERRFRRFRFFVASLFQKLDLICVPEREDAARWIWFGVRADRIRHTGNIKYDSSQNAVESLAPESMLDSLGVGVESKILFGGSTHAGEEIVLAETFLQLRAEFPDLFLVIVPRHVERASEIARDLERISLRVGLRSQPRSKPVDCLLIDTTGELRDWYSVATIVFVGKSLTARGGQNPVEPLLAGKPVLFGPHMENFSVLARSLVARAAAIQVDDAGQLRLEIARLLRDPAARENLVENARDSLREHHGATAATARLIAGLRIGGREQD